MAKYHVLEDSFINNRYVKEGEIIEYTGEVSGNLAMVSDLGFSEPDSTDNPTESTARTRKSVAS